MKISEYRELCSHLISHFGDDGYSKVYLNKCWNLWKDIDARLLSKIVEQAIKSNIPPMLEVYAKQALFEQATKPSSKPSRPSRFWQDDTTPFGHGSLEKILEENNSESLIDLILNKRIR